MYQGYCPYCRANRQLIIGFGEFGGLYPWMGWGSWGWQPWFGLGFGGWHHGHRRNRG